MVVPESERLLCSDMTEELWEAQKPRTYKCFVIVKGSSHPWTECRNYQQLGFPGPDRGGPKNLGKGLGGL